MTRDRSGMAEPKPAVPITPMLDLTFQLLFFFITLFNPNAGAKRFIEGQMDLTLPGTSAGKKDSAKQAKDPENVKPDAPSNPKVTEDDEENLDLPSDVTVTVRTQKTADKEDKGRGIISDLAVEDRAGTTQIGVDASLQELTNFLKDLRERSSHVSVTVQGDSKLKWEEMVRVMDACRRAGFDSVGFGQPPDFTP